MSKEWDIPVYDKVCINCDRWLDSGGHATLCQGKYPCRNWHKDNKENYFIPDDDYLRMAIGCKACRHEDTGRCFRCSQSYGDLWERGE